MSVLYESHIFHWLLSSVLEFPLLVFLCLLLGPAWTVQTRYNNGRGDGVASDGDEDGGGGSSDGDDGNGSDDDNGGGGSGDDDDDNE